MSTYCQYKVRKYNKDNTCSKLRGSKRYHSEFILARREFQTGLLLYSLERYPTAGASVREEHQFGLVKNLNQQQSQQHHG